MLLRKGRENPGRPAFCEPPPPVEGTGQGAGRETSGKGPRLQCPLRNTCQSFLDPL